MDVKINELPGFLINLAAIKSKQSFGEIISDEGVTPDQLFVLYVCNANGEISQTQIAQLLGRDKSNITRILKRIEEKKFIERYSCKKDSRTKLIAITPKGKKAVEHVFERVFKSDTLISNMLEEEETEQLKSILKKIIIGYCKDREPTVVEFLENERCFAKKEKTE